VPISACWPGATHAHKVNFCKFTNETATGWRFQRKFRQRFVTVINGTAAGGGYETGAGHRSHHPRRRLALRPWRCGGCRLLACWPGTGGLTRVVDKRKVRRRSRRLFLHHRGRHQGQARGAVAAGRRDRAEQQASTPKGERAKEFAGASKRNGKAEGHLTGRL